MNDPHVEELHYSVRTERPGTRMADDAVLEDVDRGPFCCSINREGQLIAVAQEHYASEAEARAVFEPYLRAWEAHADLTANFRLRFNFEVAKVVDRNPSASKVTVVGRSLTLRWNVEPASITLQDWPPIPPDELRDTDLARQMRMRWLATLDGKDRLLASAYWLLTKLEDAYGAAHVRGRPVPCSSSSKIWMRSASSPT